MEDRNFELLDVVVIKKAIEKEGVREGAIGTIVEVFNEEYVLVEFADKHGRTYAMLDLPITDLIKVYYEPAAIAA